MRATRSIRAYKPNPWSDLAEGLLENSLKKFTNILDIRVYGGII